MPDLRAAETFTAAGTRLEARLVALSLRSWQWARLELLNALLQGYSVQPIVSQVGREIGAAAAPLAPDAARLVETYVAAQLRALPDVPPPVSAGDELATLTSGLQAWQAATVGRFLTGATQLAGDTPAAIAVALTDLRSSPATSAFLWARGSLQLATEAALWGGLNGSLGGMYRQLPRRSRPYQRQVIAAVDSHTTRCCLAAHGQIRGLDEPFRTSEKPAFSPEQQQAPFHHRCRTVIALYHPAMEDVGPSTVELRASARAELARR